MPKRLPCRFYFWVQKCNIVCISSYFQALQLKKLKFVKRYKFYRGLLPSSRLHCRKNSIFLHGTTHCLSFKKFSTSTNVCKQSNQYLDLTHNWLFTESLGFPNIPGLYLIFLSFGGMSTTNCSLSSSPPRDRDVRGVLRGRLFMWMFVAFCP